MILYGIDFCYYSDQEYGSKVYCYRGKKIHIDDVVDRIGEKIIVVNGHYYLCYCRFSNGHFLRYK